MWSSGFESTLDLRLAPSRRALRGLYLLHLAPLALIPFAMQPGVPMLLLAAGLGGSWWWLRRHPAFGFGPRALTRLVWQPDAGWILYAGDRAVPAQLLGDTYATRWLVVLNFRISDGRRRSRVLLGDELPREQLRRLRARLSAGVIAPVARRSDASGAEPDR